MKIKKIRVGILFGGRSAEHEVSLQSAKNVIQAIDKKQYEVILIGIDKKGRWLLADNSNLLLNADDPKFIKLNESEKETTLIVGNDRTELVDFKNNRFLKSVDVVFPVLHGPFGEDGTVQGMLKLMSVPFVGASVLGSAVGMDKDVMKRLLKEAGIPIAKFLVFAKNDKLSFEGIVKTLGLPFFIKPANLGSSVGVSKVKSKSDFKEATEEAFQYDSKILAEEFVKGREIECSVLGNDKPIASVPGEVIPSHEFYSYEAKYLDEEGAKLEIPAKLSKSNIRKIQNLAIRAYKTLCCEGMARVDFFLRNGREAVVNEINTIPGFTKISMYPKLWEASGISYPELIDRLIQLALERFQKEQKLKSSYT